MQCKQFVKDVQCQKEATHEVFWPGQTTQQCSEHEQKLQGLALFMGFRLDSRTLVTSTNNDGAKTK